MLFERGVIFEEIVNEFKVELDIYVEVKKKR